MNHSKFAKTVRSLTFVFVFALIIGTFTILTACGDGGASSTTTAATATQSADISGTETAQGGSEEGTTATKIETVTEKPVTTSDPVTATEPVTSTGPVTSEPVTEPTTAADPGITTTDETTVPQTTADKDEPTAPATTTKAQTTSPVTTAPDPTADAKPAVKTPVKKEGAKDFHQTYSLAKVDTSSLLATGISTWGDGALTNLFDGVDGYFTIPENKFGGNLDNTGKVTITFRTVNPTKLLAYAFITGNDSEQERGRTPIKWTLSGSKDGSTWQIIDNVSDGGTADVNHEYFGYKIEKAGNEYLYYRFEFTGFTVNNNRRQLQLNECYLYIENNGDGSTVIKEPEYDENWVAAIFGGGPVVWGQNSTVNAVRNDLKSSGFDTLILWSVHVNGTTGDLVLNESVPFDVKNGEFIAHKTDFVWRGIKDGDSSIKRIELSVDAWGTNDLVKIKQLIDRDGTGSDTVLYKNMKALIEETGADAVNFDFEGGYDVDAAYKFAMMCVDMGVKITLCPYTNMNGFWKPLYDKLGDNCDRVYVQCYDGGSGNNPETWANTFGCKVIPGYWCKHGGSGDSPTDVSGKMRSKLNSITGAFIWFYDDIMKLSGTNGIKYYASEIRKLGVK